MCNKKETVQSINQTTVEQMEQKHEYYHIVQTKFFAQCCLWYMLIVVQSLSPLNLHSHIVIY